MVSRLDNGSLEVRRTAPREPGEPDCDWIEEIAPDHPAYPAWYKQLLQAEARFGQQIFACEPDLPLLPDEDKGTPADEADAS